jgi:HK97 gp10 family phage protein
MAKSVRKEVRRELRIATEFLADKIRDNTPVDTGELKQSITVRSAPYTRGRVSNDLMWEVHLNCRYAGFVEYGANQPLQNMRFVRNSVRDNKAEVVAMVRAAIARGMQTTVETSGIKITARNLDMLNFVDLA